MPLITSSLCLRIVLDPQRRVLFGDSYAAPWRACLRRRGSWARRPARPSASENGSPPSADRPAPCQRASPRSSLPATISPGPASSSGSVALACTWSNCPIFTPLREPETWTSFVLLQLARIDADEAQPLHERIDAGLEHLRHQRTARDRAKSSWLRRSRGGPCERPCPAAVRTAPARRAIRPCRRPSWPIRTRSESNGRWPRHRPPAGKLLRPSARCLRNSGPSLLRRFR